MGNSLLGCVHFSYFLDNATYIIPHLTRELHKGIFFEELRCFVRTTTSTAERTGRQVDALSKHLKNHNMLRVNWKFKKCEIVKALGISVASVALILDSHSRMRKLSARWIPHMLTIEHNRLTSYKECLASSTTIWTSFWTVS